MERLGTDIHPSGCLPGKIALQAVAGLLVGEALVGLKEHHRREHPGGDRRAPELGGLVQIGEVVVGEHRCAVLGQQQVDPPQPVTEQAPRILEAGLDLGTTERHGQFSPTRPQIANRAATKSGIS